MMRFLTLACMLAVCGCQATGPNPQRTAIAGIAATKIAVVFDSIEVDRIDDARAATLRVADDIDAYLATGDVTQLVGRDVLAGIMAAVDRADLPYPYSLIARDMATLAVVSMGTHYTPRQLLSPVAVDRLRSFVAGLRQGVAAYRVEDHPSAYRTISPRRTPAMNGQAGVGPNDTTMEDE